MKINCSWCKKFMGEKEPYDDPSTSHGKCVECLEKQVDQDTLPPVRSEKVFNALRLWQEIQSLKAKRDYYFKLSQGPCQALRERRWFSLKYLLKISKKRLTGGEGF